MRVRFAAIAVGLVSAAVAAPRAHANFHLMKVVEIFPGTAAAPNAQYVMLEMTASGQNIVGFHTLRYMNSAGVETTYTIPNNVAQGGTFNQPPYPKILFGTTAAASFFTGGGYVTDFTLPNGFIDPIGGRVCFDAFPVDCVAWGNYAGPAAGVGTPFRRAIGLRPGVAVRRRVDIGGSPTLLEDADDTDDSANDFREAVPAPTNNAGVTGAVPAATCGNGTIEGLEECDDNNTASDDMCHSDCTLGRIFADGMETGNLTRWTNSSVDGGDLVVNNGGAISGSFGAVATVNDTNSLFMEDLTPDNEGHYRARFQLDPGSFDPGENQNHRRARILIGFSENPSRRVFAVVLRRVSGGFAISARVRADDNSQVDTLFYDILTSVHTVEIDWVRSIGAGLGTGQLRLWIDGDLKQTLTSIDNDTAEVDFVRWGILNVKGGASGFLHFDGFDSRRTTYVGP